MAALTQDRNTPRREGKRLSYPMKGSVIGYIGAIAVLASGLLKPGVTETGSVAVGVFVDRFDNSSGADSAIKGEAESGVFRFANSASSDEITLSEVGSDCYIVDDQTVAKTDGSSARSVAGKVVDVDAQGVWVKVGIV